MSSRAAFAAWKEAQMALDQVLVATDLTDASEMALERTLAFSTACNIILLHVLRAGLPDPLRMQLHSVIEGYLADRAMYARGAASNIVRPVVATGRPFATIVSEAVAHRAQLIVVGEPALMRRPHLFVGSTAECVARLTDRPLLMVKRAGTGPYQHVTVALDGAPAAVRALRTAAVLAPQAELRAIYAMPSSRVDLKAKTRSVGDVKSRIRAELDAAFGSEAGGSHGVVEIVETPPYSALKHASDSTDLLVMGTHSKAAPWAANLEIGKLVHYMLAEAPCDVLVSPP
jgi:nucleotide-binding universal stress UspA family protein